MDGEISCYNPLQSTPPIVTERVQLGS